MFVALRLSLSLQSSRSLSPMTFSRSLLTSAQLFGTPPGFCLCLTAQIAASSSFGVFKYPSLKFGFLLLPLLLFTRTAIKLSSISCGKLLSRYSSDAFILFQSLLTLIRGIVSERISGSS